jgi:hypothetical protein
MSSGSTSMVRSGRSQVVRSKVDSRTHYDATMCPLYTAVKTPGYPTADGDRVDSMRRRSNNIRACYSQVAVAWQRGTAEHSRARFQPNKCQCDDNCPYSVGRRSGEGGDMCWPGEQRPSSRPRSTRDKQCRREAAPSQLVVCALCVHYVCTMCSLCVHRVHHVRVVYIMGV